MGDTNQRLNEILWEVLELTTSLDFTQEEVKEEITNTNSNLNTVKTEVQELRKDVLDPDYVTNNLIDLKDRSRRNNIRINGLRKNNMKLVIYVKRKGRVLFKKSQVLKVKLKSVAVIE